MSDTTTPHQPVNATTHTHYDAAKTMTDIKTEKYTLMLGECLERMREIPTGTVDMVMADLPYGTTACKWDSIIPFAPLWEQYRRVCKENAAIVLTASQPFTSALVMSNPKEFSHEWVWNKTHAANFPNANRQPLKIHENVLVFSRRQATYNPQKTQGAKNHNHNNDRPFKTDSRILAKRTDCDLSGMKHPKSIQEFPKHSSSVGLHPTQKPIALMEYLIRTYTHEGETVLDNTMGSGTTGVACINTGRKFIGIERDEAYFGIAMNRIQSHA